MELCLSLVGSERRRQQEQPQVAIIQGTDAFVSCLWMINSNVISSPRNSGITRMFYPPPSFCLWRLLESCWWQGLAVRSMRFAGGSPEGRGLDLHAREHLGTAFRHIREEQGGMFSG